MGHKYIKFTGDFGKLKSMGYEFGKLFASNYMQWSRGGTRVWKKGGDVTLERVLNHTGVFFEVYMANRNNLPWQTISGRDRLYVVVNQEDGTVSFDYESYVAECREAMAVPRAYKLESRSMSRKELEPLEELIELGWVELAEWEDK